MKKLKYFFASAIVLVAVAVSTIVFAEYKEQKGDLRANNQISNESVSVIAGNETLSENGSVKVVKTVSKTDTEGVYNVKFDISAKEKENKSTTPIYAVVAFDNSGSMICDFSKKSYAYSSNDFFGTRKSYTASLGDGETIYCSNSYYDSSVILKDKWESAVKGTKSFTNEILSIDSSKISYVTFADYADDATQWYVSGDTIPSSVYSHPVGATNLSDAINKAYNKLNDNDIPTNAKKIIIVISDGEPTEPGNDPIQSAKNSASTAKSAGIKIYTIGYAVTKDSTAATVLNDVSSNSTNDKTNYSFIAGQDNVSDIFKKLATDITKDYAKDGVLTDTIGESFKFTSSNDDVKVDGQNVSFTIDKLTTEPTSFSFNITVDDENITEDGWYKTNEGFNLTYTDVDGNSQTITSPEDPEVYWVAKRYNYKIEYYYDGQIDDTLTETGEDVKGKEITVSEESIKNNTKEGYSLKSVDPSSKKIEISSTGENVIKVYYERNSYDYEVHYFYNGNEDISLKEIKSAKYGEVINAYTDNLKTGYKLDKVKNLPLTIKTKGNVINVYYVTDETQTKELSYTVKYYKNGVLTDTDTFKETKQVLENNKLTVKKGDINVTNKYVGYKFDKTNPSDIPNTIENGGVIEVYYVKDEFEYTVEYYYNGKIDKSKTESSKAEFESVIDTYKDKKEKGYKLDKKENLPLTVSEDKTKNVIKVYYVTDETQTKKVSYTVEYYKDNVLTDTDKVTETKQVLENDELTVEKSEINVTNKYVGYSFVKTEPTNIPNTIENNGVIKVYYERNSYDYEVHYFFNGNEDTSLIERDSAKYEEVISTYIDKVRAGYKLDRVDNLPLIISTEDNVINVYYVTDNNQTKTLSYTVEYYKGGVLTDIDTFKKTKQLLDSDTLTVKLNKINTVNKYPGYKFEKTNPSEIPEIIEDGGVIKVYYVKDEFSYSVEYYYDGKIDNSKTETSSALFESVIETYEDKNITGYVLSKVENLPLTISENETKNVIRVYYVKGTYKYTVNYYYDNVLDKDSTDTFEAKFEDVITTYEQKIRTGYVLDKVTGLDLTISADESKNVINVYYKKAKYSYVVEYYYDNVLDGTKTDSFKATYNEVIETYKDKVITGYELDKVEGTPLTVTEIATNNTIRVYYKKASYTYEVRYYFNRILDETLTEKGTALYGEKITSYTDKVKEDYILETVENLPLEISANESKNIINVYYKIDGQGVIEPIEPPHTSVNNGIYALIVLVNALGVSVLLKKREN